MCVNTRETVSVACNECECVCVGGESCKRRRERRDNVKYAGNFFVDRQRYRLDEREVEYQ